MVTGGERGIVLERWQASRSACQGCQSLDGLLFFEGGGPEPGPPPGGVHWECNCRRRLVDTSQMSEVRLMRLAREARDNGRRTAELLEIARELASQP
jgi:hypothetical protein